MTPTNLALNVAELLRQGHRIKVVNKVLTNLIWKYMSGKAEELIFVA